MKLDSQNGKNQISGQIIRQKWADNCVQMQKNDMNEKTLCLLKKTHKTVKDIKKDVFCFSFSVFSPKFDQMSRVGSRDCHM